MEQATNTSSPQEQDNSGLYFFIFILSVSAVMIALALLPIWITVSIAGSLVAIASYRFVVVMGELGNQEPHGRHPDPQ